MRYFQEAFMEPWFYQSQDWNVPAQEVLEQPHYALRQVRAGQDHVLFLPPTAGHHPNIVEPLVKHYMQHTDLGINVFHLYEAQPFTSSAYVSIADLVAYVKNCLEASGPCHVVGLCQGGWLAFIVAALYPKYFQSLTLVNAPIDTHADPENLIYTYTQMLPSSFYEQMVAWAGGVQAGMSQLFGFYALSWDYLLFDRYAELFDAVQTENEKAIQKWHRNKSWYDQPLNIAGTWYLQAVQWLFKENRLARGELVIDGQAVKPENIDCLVYLLSGEEDHITTTPQLFAAGDLVSGSVKKYTVPKTGHIATFMPQKAPETWDEITTEQEALDLIAGQMDGVDYRQEVVETEQV